MDSNDDSGSTNPTNQTTTNEKIAENVGIIAASSSKAPLGRDSAAESEPRISNAVAVTGKRRRSSEANETRRDITGQTDSLQNDDAGTNAAAALPAYQGNGTFKQPICALTMNLAQLTAPFYAVLSLEFRSV
jgi:hypothetical protein